jgi:hypothetical protein
MQDCTTQDSDAEQVKTGQYFVEQSIIGLHYMGQ